MFVFDLQESIKNHWPGFVHVQGVGLHVGLDVWSVWVPSVDLEGLEVRSLCGSCCHVSNEVLHHHCEYEFVC